MATAEYTQTVGEALVARHLGSEWSFGLDHARSRAGCCHYTKKKITCSVYLIAYLAEDEVDQIILHEIAHGLVGVREGHGRTWMATARSLGYLGGRTVEIPEARISARWQGVCARGHEVHRHRKPKQRVYCGTCAKSRLRKEIIWKDRGLDLIARG